MKKIVMKVDPAKLAELSTDKLIAIREAQGMDHCFLHSDAFAAVQVEISRRARAALDEIGAVALEVESSGPEWGYPAADELAQAGG